MALLVATASRNSRRFSSEVPEDMAADDLAVVERQERCDALVAGEEADVKMVVPEIRHHLAQLPAAVDRAHPGRGPHLGGRPKPLDPRQSGGEIGQRPDLL